MDIIHNQSSNDVMQILTGEAEESVEVRRLIVGSIQSMFQINVHS